ncbi:hypothetical protein ACFV2D_32100 [Streptomyces capillispiralis]|uniref:hypothetical protein n=1 Tax=Streptomyces capillispiralis TaxID=68182 RepID=UPI0036B83D3E
MIETQDSTPPGRGALSAVTNDNKQSWVQCGAFSPSSANGRITTPAYPTSGSASRAFRVCAMAAIPVRDTGITCTPWW